MGIAYLILAHADPCQFQRLVRALDSPNAAFFVHVDRKTPITPFLIKEPIEGQITYLPNRVKVFWAGYSLVNAVLRMLKAAVESRRYFSHYVLLSGADYPIKPRGYIESFFFETDRDFLDCFQLPGNCWKAQRGGLDRIDCYHLNDAELMNPRVNHLVGRKVRALLRLFCKFHRRTLPNGLIAYGGSQWWAFTNDTAKHVLRFLGENPAVEHFFRLTYAPDELIFHTMLMNSDLKENIERDNLRLILWDREQPAILQATDWDVVTKSTALFARKFESKKSSSIIDLIDRQILKVAEDMY